MKLLSTEAEGVNIAIPESDRQVFVNSAGRVGALLGLKSPDAGTVSFGSCFRPSCYSQAMHLKVCLPLFWQCTLVMPINR